MRKLFTQAGLLLALAGAALVACKREVDTLQPTSSAASGTAPPSLTELKTWYAGRTSASYIQHTGSSTARSASPDSLNWLAVRWEKLDTITNGEEPLAFLPVEGGPAGFTSGHQGYRRLVLGKQAGRPPSGLIIEVIHTGDVLPPGQVNQVFRALYNAQQQGQVAQLAGFTGFTAFYSRENYYLTGRTYKAGIPSANRRWLVTTPVTSPTAARKQGSVQTLDVDITCVSSIVNASTSLGAGEDVVIWNCSVSAHGGGGGSTPPYPGSDTGPGGGGGKTGGGGGGGGGPIPNEQYDDGSGNGYGGYPPSSGDESGNSAVLSPTSVIVSSSIHNDPKAECVLNKLLANDQFKIMLRRFQNSAQYKVSFNIGTIISGATGNCTWNPTTSTAIVLVNKSVFDLQHAIWGATTFFHETYHAQLQQYAIATFGTLVIGKWPKPVNDMTLQ